jgi:hypothetical protein
MGAVSNSYKRRLCFLLTLTYYYLLPLEEDERTVIDETLSKIGYDLDDRGGAWSDRGDVSYKDSEWSIIDISKVINSMTKENAAKVIWDEGFLPEPVASKFAELLSLK